ncbi:MAG: AAA family ATPase [Bacilli bacterium]|nr:AAA family ATPase [Bacilli bacterium]
MLALPLGIDDFKKVVKECYYVDKTLLLKDLCSLPSGTTTILTRPRRFGKSLTISMVRYFFESKDDDLFDDLAISNYKEAMSLRGRYPVIYINLKECVAESFEGFLTKFRSLALKELERQSFDSFASKRLSLYFDSLYQNKLSGEELSEFVLNLCDALFEKYQEDCIILFDEYDRPLVHSREKGFFEPMITFYQTLLGGPLKSNPHLRLGLITGVLRIGKESLFSGLNNPRIEDVLTGRFGQYFGFDMEECFKLLSYYGLGDKLKDILKWYGGYKTGENAMVNPHSLLSFIEAGGEIDTYWANTSNESAIEEVFNIAGENALPLLQTLLQHGTIDLLSDGSVSYKDLNSLRLSLPSILLSSGYLTVREKVGPRQYVLSIPNKEVMLLLNNQLIERFLQNRYSLSLPSRLRNAFENGDCQEIEQILTNAIFPSLSYFELSVARAYQIVALTISALLFEQCIVKSEVPEGEGRCDILIMPRNGKKFGAVIELKYSESNLSLSQMEQRALTGLKQIEKMNYLESLRIAGASPLYGYGICFVKKKAKVLAKRFDK